MSQTSQTPVSSILNLGLERYRIVRDYAFQSPVVNRTVSSPIGYIENKIVSVADNTDVVSKLDTVVCSYVKYGIAKRDALSAHMQKARQAASTKVVAVRAGASGKVVQVLDATEHYVNKVLPKDETESVETDETEPTTQARRAITITQSAGRRIRKRALDGLDCLRPKKVAVYVVSAKGKVSSVVTDVSTKLSVTRTAVAEKIQDRVVKPVGQRYVSMKDIAQHYREVAQSRVSTAKAQVVSFSAVPLTAHASNFKSGAVSKYHKVMTSMQEKVNKNKEEGVTDTQAALLAFTYASLVMLKDGYDSKVQPFVNKLPFIGAKKVAEKEE